MPIKPKPDAVQVTRAERLFLSGWVIAVLTLSAGVLSGAPGTAKRIMFAIALWGAAVMVMGLLKEVAREGLRKSSRVIAARL